MTYRILSAVVLAAATFLPITTRAATPDTAVYVDALPQAGVTYITMTLTRYLKNSTFLPSQRTFPEDALRDEAFTRMMDNPDKHLGYGHVNPSEANVTLFEALGKLHLHLRDPRQALVAWMDYTERHSHHKRTLGRTALPPEDYWDWEFDAKFAWQVENFYVNCIDWLTHWADELDRDDRGYEILTTTFEEMVGDPLEFFHEVLAFYNADPDGFEDGNLLPLTKLQWHFDETDVATWRTQLSDEQQNLVTSMLSDRLLTAFGWSR